MTHHGASLARLVKNRKPPGWTDAIKRDYQRAELSERERALCDYARKLTSEPWSVTRADLEPLRAAGLDDRAILDANLVVSYFNYVNRIADGLGIELEPYWSEPDEQHRR